jgi:hypothetical protein
MAGSIKKGESLRFPPFVFRRGYFPRVKVMG